MECYSFRASIFSRAEFRTSSNHFFAFHPSFGCETTFRSNNGNVGKSDLLPTIGTNQVMARPGDVSIGLTMLQDLIVTMAAVATLFVASSVVGRGSLTMLTALRDDHCAVRIDETHRPFQSYSFSSSWR